MPDAGPTDAVGVPELSAPNREQGTTGSEEKQRNVPPEQAVSEQADDRGSAANSDGLDRDWIRRQSGQHFTIQLAAARSLTAARQHVTGFGDLPVRFVPTRSNSQEFVVVLAGVYPGRAEAERALEKLPKALREQGYWVRSVDSVRRSLRDD
jgi:DamX protein